MTVIASTVNDVNLCFLLLCQKMNSQDITSLYGIQNYCHKHFPYLPFISTLYLFNYLSTYTSIYLSIYLTPSIYLRISLSHFLNSLFFSSSGGPTHSWGQLEGRDAGTLESQAVGGQRRLSHHRFRQPRPRRELHLRTCRPHTCLSDPARVEWWVWWACVKGVVMVVVRRVSEWEEYESGEIN